MVDTAVYENWADKYIDTKGREEDICLFHAFEETPLIFLVLTYCLSDFGGLKLFSHCKQRTCVFLIMHLYVLPEFW